MTTMTINSTTAVSTTSPINVRQSAWKWLKATGKRLALAYTVYNERRELRNISDDALADIGMTRTEVNQEAHRSLFDIPENRS